MASKDKLVTDRTLIDEIICQSQICHLACSREDRPYLVPLSFGYDGEAIYLHTSRAGKKIEIFEANPRVCLSFVSRSDLVTDPERACEWSFAYASVLAEGTISEIEDPETKTRALNWIMDHYSGKDWPFTEKTLARTRIWKVILENPTAKISPLKD